MPENPNNQSSINLYFYLLSISHSLFLSLSLSLYIYIYIYIYISSSSCRTGSTDIPDPLSPLLPIVHRPRQTATKRFIYFILFGNDMKLLRIFWVGVKLQKTRKEFCQWIELIMITSKIVSAFQKMCNISVLDVEEKTRLAITAIYDYQPSSGYCN